MLFGGTNEAAFAKWRAPVAKPSVHSINDEAADDDIEIALISDSLGSDETYDHSAVCRKISRSAYILGQMAGPLGSPPIWSY